MREMRSAVTRILDAGSVLPFRYIIIIVWHFCQTQYRSLIRFIKFIVLVSLGDVYSLWLTYNIKRLMFNAYCFYKTPLEHRIYSIAIEPPHGHGRRIAIGDGFLREDTQV